jgi:hypothetical protein
VESRTSHFPLQAHEDARAREPVLPFNERRPT